MGGASRRESQTAKQAISKLNGGVRVSFFLQVVLTLGPKGNPHLLEQQKSRHSNQQCGQEPAEPPGISGPGCGVGLCRSNPASTSQRAPQVQPDRAHAPTPCRYLHSPGRRQCKGLLGLAVLALLKSVSFILWRIRPSVSQDPDFA